MYVKGRIDGLDGLRSVAVLIVLISHYIGVVIPSYPWLRELFPGMLGVTIFFVISGFLISTLLVNEYRQTNDINIKNFYIRRFLRLSPALYIYLSIFTLAYFFYDGKIQWKSILSAITYTSNYYQVMSGSAIYYMPVWSLAIEEHFYLIFPAVMLFAMRHSLGRLTALVTISIVVISLWRLVVASADGIDWHHIYWRTDTRLDSILFGVLLTCLTIDPASRGRKLFENELAVIVGLVILAISTVYREEYFRMTTRYTMQGIALMLIIGHIVFNRNRLSRAMRNLLDSVPMKYVSERSYSLYLYHLTILKFAEHVFGALTPLRGAICLAASFLLADLSYRWIESPVMGLRRRFGSHVEIKVAGDAIAV